MVPSDARAPRLRVTHDDPEYRRQAAAEAAFWRDAHPFGFERSEKIFTPGPGERHLNERFTGDPDTDWVTTIGRRGTFRRGLVLGASSPQREVRLFGTNPELHATLVDVSASAVKRRVHELRQQFPGRVTGLAADLNFLSLPPERYDLVVSSSTVHHVTNLEHLAWQINRTLTAEGRFFLEDYVGEPRFAFAASKRRLYEILYERDIARQRGRRGGLVWRDDSDLSPFCGVRSDEILEVFRHALDEVELRTAATLTMSMSRAYPADLEALFRNAPRWKWWRAKLFETLGIRRRRIDVPARFFEELVLVGDVASDAGALRPGVAFVVYRKRT